MPPRVKINGRTYRWSGGVDLTSARSDASTRKRIGNYEFPESTFDAASKVSRQEFIGPSPFPLIRLHRRRVDRRPIGVESEKQACLITRHFRLQPHKCVFGHKERPLHRTVMTPEPNRPARRIENSALIWEIEHGPFTALFNRYWKSSIFAGLRHPVPTNNLLLDCVRMP